MRIATLLGPVAQLVRRAANARNYTLLLGTAAGVYLLTACHLFLATFGTSLQSATALALAVALGFELAWKPQRVTVLPEGALRAHAMLVLLTAAWMFALPWGLQFALSAAGQISMEVMAAPGRALLFQVLTAIVLLSPPLFLLVRVALLLPRFLRFSVNASPGIACAEPQARYRWRDLAFDVFRWCRSLRRKRVELPSEVAILTRYLFGVTAGVLLSLFVTGPTIGLYAGAMIFAVLGALVFLAVWFRAPLFPASKPEAPAKAAPAPPLLALRASIARSRVGRACEALWHGATVMAAAALAAVLLRMLNQLAAEAAYLVYFEWGMILLGVTIGMTKAEGGRRKGDTTDAAGRLSAFRFPLVLAVVGAATLAGYSLLIDLSLWINAFVVAPWLTIAARCLVVAAVLLPFGWAWGRLATWHCLTDAGNDDRQERVAGGVRQAVAQRSGGGTLPALSLFAFAGGFLAVRWVAFERVGTANTLVAVVWLLAALAAARRFLVRSPATRTLAASGALASSATTRWATGILWLKRSACTGSIALLLALPWLRSLFDPVRTARQLFATNVFVARMHGLDRGMLSFLDEGRPVAVAEGRRGTLTVWRYRGTQLQVRENGVPKAIVSTNPQLAPHFSAEVMPVALPMVLHEHPHHVLILGASGGVSLTTTLSFPIKSVTCVEGDAELVDLLRKHVWSESKDRPASDARVNWVPLEPALAVACGGDTYDVIVSTPDESALLKTSPYFTQGFYRGVSRRLAEDGIFCQRFHQVDYGAMPLQTAVKTLQDVFRFVGTIEIAAGEMALLATNSPHGLTRGGLVERFQAPQVRTVLARIGWDWSFPLNLTAYGHDGLREFADAESARVNTAANGFFAFRLPQEMMRWAPKWQEQVTKLAPYRTRLLESTNVEGNDEVLLRRLSEVAGQRKLMASYPDQWWAYRKSLRHQLEKRPRTLLRKSRSGDVGNAIHPEDRRRMRYFKELDEATKHPSVERAANVAAFAEPYDPLVSRFAHLEAATLYSRPEVRDERAEAWHRLHAVYFADPHDRSVRNVATAMKLLAENDKILDRPADRWDHLNALMQELKARWERRGLILPRSPQVVLNDLELSLDSVDAALRTMDRLHAAVPVPESDWQARRKVVERGLVHPLRSYRSQLLRKHQNERERIRRLMQKLEEDDAKRNDAKPSEAQKLRPAAN